MSPFISQLTSLTIFIQILGFPSTARTICCGSSAHEGSVILKESHVLTPSLPRQMEYLVYNGNETILLTNHCNGRIAIYMNHYIYLTLDGFQEQTSALTIPIFLGTTVSSVGFLDSSSMLLLIGDRVYRYYVHDQEYRRLSMTNIITVHVASHCSGLYNVTLTASINDDKVVLDVTTPDDAFQHVMSPISIQIDISRLTVIPAYSLVVGFVQIDDDHVQFVHIDVAMATETVYTSPFSISGDVYFKVFDIPSGDMLIWDSRMLFFSPTAGQTVLPVTVNGMENDTIQTYTVGVGNTGEYAVLTVDGQLVFGRQRQAVKIADGITVNKNTSLMITGDSDIIIIDVNEVTSLPYVRDIFYAGNSLQYDCPFQSIESTLHSQQIYYFDAQTTLNLSVNLITQPWQQNQILVTMTRPDLLRLQHVVYSDEIIAPGTYNKILTLTLTNVMDVATRSSHTNLVSIRINPVFSSLSCYPAPQKVADIVVGCPPDRSIRVRNKPEVCKNIETGVLHTSDTEVVLYDYPAWGCPVSVYYTDTLLPTVDLYHDNIFAEEVQVDFVVSEDYNKTNFDYSLNAVTAGCLTVPQNWSVMRTSWTREKYKKCYDTEEQTDSNVVSSLEYQILNSSNGNSLQWYENDYYVYTLTVVDPEYSFCHLSTKFVVHVHGVLEEHKLARIVTIPLTCTLAVIFVLVTYIIVQKHLKKQEDKSEEDDG